MALPQQADLLSLDYGFAGAPAVLVAAKTLDTHTLDYGLNGAPFAAAPPDSIPSSGTVAVTFADLIAAVAGASYGGTAGATFGDMIAAVSGAERFSGAVGVTFDDLIVAVTGGVARGAVAATFGDLSVAIAGASYTGSVGISFDDLTVAVSGSEGFHGAIAATFGDLGVSASGGAITGAVVATFADLSVSVAGGYSTAAIAVTFGDLSPGAVAVEHLGPPTVTGTDATFIGSTVVVTVTGTNFLTVTNVLFGPYEHFLYPFAGPTILSNTQLQVFMRSPFYLSSGGEDSLVVDTRVINDDGESPPNPPVDEVTLVAPPVVTSIAPAVLSGADGTPTLALTGRNFTTAFLLQFFDQDVSTAITVAPDGRTASVTLLPMSAILAAMGAGAYPAKFWNLAGSSDFNTQTIVVIGGAPFTFGAIDDALSGRYGQPVISYRYERRKRDFSFIEDITRAFIYTTSSGTTIHLDNDQAVSRTADFLIRADQLPPGVTFSMVSGEAVAVWADVLVGGSTISFCLGLFHLDAPTRVQHPLGYEEWQAKGSDMTLVLANRATTAAYVIPAATNYADAARALVSSFGLTLAHWYALGGAPNTPVAFSWPPKTVYLQLLAELLFGINGYPVWADNEGRITTQPRVEPARNPPAVIYQEAAEPRMIVPPSTVTPQQTQFANYATVAIDDPRRTAYAAAFTNADPSSPISTVASGRFEPLQISGSGSPSGKALVDGPTADAVASYELQEEATRAVARTLVTKLDPRRTNHEYYLVDLEDYEHLTLWRAKTWDYQCWPGGVMTHTLGLASPVAISTGAPSLTAFLGLLGSVAVADVVPLAADACTIRCPRAVPAGHTLLLAFLTDAPTISLGGAIAGLSPVGLAALGPFGLPGSHPVAGAGMCALYVYGIQLPGGLAAGDAVTLLLTGGSYLAAAAAWEVVVGDGPTADAAGAYGAGQDAAGANTLRVVAPTSTGGPTGRTTFWQDIVIGAVGAVWSTADPVVPRTFTPDVGQGWDPAQALALQLPALNGLQGALFVNLQVTTGTGQFTLSGSFGQPAAAWGVAVQACLGLSP